VLSPIGTALLGLSVGQSIDWDFPDGSRRTLRVDEVMNQPERRLHRNADAWGAAIAGGILFALPMAGGLYRGSFGWMDVVVAVIGAAALAVGYQRRVTRCVRKLCSGW
jgi:hypothetical protein